MTRIKILPVYVSIILMTTGCLKGSNDNPAAPAKIEAKESPLPEPPRRTDTDSSRADKADDPVSTAAGRDSGDNSASPKADDTAPSQTLPPSDAISIPPGFEVLAQATGDLDQDGIAELVTAFNYKKKGADDTLFRELRLYRATDGEWTLWKSIPGGIGSSDSGGAWGDPFDSIEVKRGALVINHYGGASERWGTTHRYRYQQGAFLLIGATAVSFSTFCHFNQTLDINLSTARAVYTQEGAPCDNSEADTASPPKKERIEFEHTRRPLPAILTSETLWTTSVAIPGTDFSMTY